jgi:uncharacterized protein
MMKNNTAILLFSRTATAEAAAKPLAVTRQSAQSVASFLINHTRKLAKSTQLPLFIFSEKQQRGDTFGERFANAFEDIYALGFQSVIAVGNDCLTLSKYDILTAASQLQTTPLVLGATTDGGAYLVGLDRCVFQKKAFQNIEWQTNVTCENIVQFVGNQGFKSVFISKKSDLDSVADWQKTLQTVSSFLRKKLNQILHIPAPILSAAAILPINNRFLSASIAFRAPPFSL